MNYFDVETIPASKEHVEAMMPDELKKPIMPEELRHPTMPFFEHKGLKDATKQEDWKKGKERDWKADHAAKIAKWNMSNFDKVSAYHERAALNPETAVVAVIGYGFGTNDDKILVVNAAVAGAFLNVKKPAGFKIQECRDEKEILEDWISSMIGHCNTLPHGGRNIAGFAIKNFDLPFIRKRCWLLGIPFPRLFSAGRLSGYMWDDNFIDLQEVWASGDRTVRVSQDYLCTVFGIETKPSEGKLFWKYLRDDPAAAFLYAAHDINTIVKLGDRMGIVKKTTTLGLL